MLDLHIAFSAAGSGSWSNYVLHFVLTYLVEISQEVKSGTGSEVSEVMINGRVP